ncbi:uncharacterized protein METZ01_LOCUS169686, partial [marine metagenome]
VPVDYGPLPILGDIPVNLLLGLLPRKLEIGTEEVLGVYPRAWHPVDSDIVEHQQVGSDDCPPLTHLLFSEQFLLTAEPHSKGFEVVAQNVLKDFGCTLGVTLID